MTCNCTKHTWKVLGNKRKWMVGCPPNQPVFSGPINCQTISIERVCLSGTRHFSEVGLVPLVISYWQTLFPQQKLIRIAHV